MSWRWILGSLTNRSLNYEQVAIHLVLALQIIINHSHSMSQSQLGWIFLTCRFVSRWARRFSDMWKHVFDNGAFNWKIICEGPTKREKRSSEATQFVVQLGLARPLFRWGHWYAEKAIIISIHSHSIHAGNEPTMHTWWVEPHSGNLWNSNSYYMCLVLEGLRLITFIYTYTYIYIDVGNQGKISNAFFLWGGNRFSAPLEIRSAVGLTRLLLTARQFSIGKKSRCPAIQFQKTGTHCFGHFPKCPEFWSLESVPF